MFVTQSTSHSCNQTNKLHTPPSHLHSHSLPVTHTPSQSLTLPPSHSHSLPVTYTPLPVTHTPLPVTHTPLPVTHTRLPVTHTPLPVTYTPLPVTHTPSQSSTCIHTLYTVIIIPLLFIVT